MTPFTIERSYNAPVKKVWDAITNNASMKNWYFDLEDFKPEVDFEFQFWGEDKGVKFLHLCRVVAVEQEKKLAYTWRYDGRPGNSTVTFELFPEDASETSEPAYAN
ncbi:MAG: hypothetical protein EOP48_25670 [Sphingobacteriales bacterium]|nr:MAG: hypothetical protein EOP48_25670 [Sphingobacteriales bacterium]